MTETRSLRVALGQMLVIPGAAEANLARAEAMIGEAAQQGAQVILLPEALDLGWTAATAQTMAEPLPGPRAARLSAAARAHGMVVAAGLTERDGTRIYNSAVLIDADGCIVGTHRKIAELDFAREIYATGSTLGVAQTAIGRVGLAICADLWSPTLGQALGAMGAQLILSPTAWAVPPGFDNSDTPYGSEWVASYRAICSSYGIPVVAVSNVGPVTHGAWAGHSCIGASIAIAGDASIAARGPFGAEADSLIIAALRVQD